jgi:fluoroacetyl-CoA thioesterase
VKETLRAGIEHRMSFVVPETKTVPALYPESPEFQQMPRVFATGYLVGLVEWACLRALESHLDWPREQSVGTHVDLSHSAATPPGAEVVVEVRLIEVDGRRLVFQVSARDDAATICEGRHERFVIDAARFAERLAKRRAG